MIKKLLDKFMARYFFSEEAVYFCLMMVSVFLIIFFFGGILLPVLISLVIAFLLNGFINYLQTIFSLKWVSVSIGLLVFFSFYLSLFFILPSIGSQINAFIQGLPKIISDFQVFLTDFSSSYLSEEEISNVFSSIADQIRNLLSMALTTIAGTISVAFNAVLYAILIPLMVFFFVKDKERLSPLVSFVLPNERNLINKIFSEMNDQLFNYVTGKFIEMLIVWGVSFAFFSFLNLPYSFLLSMLVGLSVIIPIFGALLVTIPVLLVGLSEWGITENFFWLFIGYLVIQGLDGNVLSPILFSATNNLHPVVIIVSVLFFGGIWGFWGLFFAIPLATFIKAIISSWPKNDQTEVGL